MVNSNDFTHFLSVFESGEMGLEIGDIHLYYFLCDKKLQVISEFRPGQFYDLHYSDKLSVLTMDVKDNTSDIKEILKLFLSEFIISQYVHNYPFYLKSDTFTIEEYNQLRETALQKLS